MKIFSSIILFLFQANLLFSAVIQTDYLIFVFDHGDKNMIASMLNYAKAEEEDILNQLDFRIVFMGPATDAMPQEPFSSFPDKLIHYKQLGIEEQIDIQWKRNKKLSQESIEKLTLCFNVNKKIWVPVSCSIFEQLLHHYQENTDTEIVAIRDNPNPNGDTDYFAIANQIQSISHKVAVPSFSVAQELNDVNQKVSVIGHGPLEDWVETTKRINKEEIIKRLGINSEIPVILYAGVYGEGYEESFQQFLDFIPKEGVQVLVVPHPRYKGIVERRILEKSKKSSAFIHLIGDKEIDPSKNATAIEVISISDAVFIADATSTMVSQANAIKKKVFYVNTVKSTTFRDNPLIQKVTSQEEFSKVVKNIKDPSTNEDVFSILGVPKNGSRLLWEELLR